MNWIAQKFEELKALVEKHVPATNKKLQELENRVAALEYQRAKSTAS
jgi:hypothetical protein